MATPEQLVDARVELARLLFRARMQVCGYAWAIDDALQPDKEYFAMADAVIANRAALLAAMGGDVAVATVHASNSGLMPCPFCGKELNRRDRKSSVNPRAWCATPECFGAKAPVVNLDDPLSVQAWNTRPEAVMGGNAVPVAWTNEEALSPHFSEYLMAKRIQSAKYPVPLYRAPPTLSAIAEGMRERCAQVAESFERSWIEPAYEITGTNEDGTPWSYWTKEVHNRKLSDGNEIAAAIRALPPAPGEG